MSAALEGGECSAGCPSCTLPLEKTWYPFYGRLLHHQYNVIIDKTTELLLQHVLTLSCSGYFIGHKNAKSKIYKYKGVMHKFDGVRSDSLPECIMY